MPRRFTRRWRLSLAPALALALGSAAAHAQTAGTSGSAGIRDEPLVRRGMYDRPYVLRLGSGSSDVALGGYFDLVAGAVGRDGVSEGFSTEARRFNLFVTSRIADRLRLTSEIEFEHGAEEIALETAALDLLLHHALNLRGGILLVPIGKFNLAHDSPLYDIIDRPLVSTRLIPATWSEVGGGVFGALYPGGHKLTYEVYVVNGLQDGVVDTTGTHLPGGKSRERFGEDNNGQPAVTARVGYAAPPRRRVQIETAVSFYSGVYNRFQREGVQIDQPRWLHVLAWDGEAALGPVTVRGEVAYARVDVPPRPLDVHATDQVGAYGEVIGKLLQRRVLWFERAALAAVGRVDWVDLNLGRLPTGAPIGDETYRLSLGLSLRPAPGTALRVVYQHEWFTDTFNNPGEGGGVQLGMASYF